MCLKIHCNWPYHHCSICTKQCVRGLKASVRFPGYEIQRTAPLLGTLTLLQQPGRRTEPTSGFTTSYLVIWRKGCWSLTAWAGTPVPALSSCGNMTRVWAPVSQLPSVQWEHEQCLPLGLLEVPVGSMAWSRHSASQCHWLSGHGFEQTPEDRGWRSLECCGSRGREESDVT